MHIRTRTQVQLVCMGTGSDEYANLLRNSAGRYHGKICAHIGFTPELEHKIIAGADILLMPSRYNPNSYMISGASFADALAAPFARALSLQPMSE